MSYLRKTINFNSDIQREQNVYDLLDRVRYRQSDFVIKLLDEFFRKNNINKDTPYSYLKVVIKSYLDNALPGTGVIQPQIGMNELMQLYLPTLIQQMQASGNMPIGNPIMPMQNQSHDITENPLPVSDSDNYTPAKGKKKKKPETIKENELPTSPKVQSANSFVPTVDDDDSEDISDLQGMAMGFQSLLD